MHVIKYHSAILVLFVYQFYLLNSSKTASKLGVSGKLPKPKYKNFKSIMWFSYKILTKISKYPMVHIHNWQLPEQHYFNKKLKQAIFFILSKKLFLFNSIYTGPYQQTAFGINFGPQEGPKLENHHFPFHAFSGWCTFWGPVSIPNQFSDKVLYIYFLFFLYSFFA